MKVKLKKLHPDAVVPFKKHESDFCYDVVATSREQIGSNVWKYGLGLAFQIDRGVLAELPSKFAISFRPRSSVYKTGLVLSNCVGTIDEDYRGEVSAIFYKVADGEIYNVGDRIGQIYFSKTVPMDFEVVDEISDTERGAGGFGSTGK